MINFDGKPSDFSLQAHKTRRSRASAMAALALLTFGAVSGCCSPNRKQVAFQEHISDVGAAVSRAVAKRHPLSQRKLISMLGPPDVVLNRRTRLRDYLKKSPWGESPANTRLVWKYFAAYANGRMPRQYATSFGRNGSGVRFWKWRARHPEVKRNAVHPKFLLYDEEKRYKHPVSPCFCCASETVLEIFAVVHGRVVNALDFQWRIYTGG